MERRREPRIQVSKPARVTMLDGERQTLSAVIEDFSGKGMRIEIPISLPVNGLVKIEADELLLLGEVCWCTSSATGYRIGLFLQHAMHLSAQIGQLASALQSLQSALNEVPALAAATASGSR